MSRTARTPEEQGTGAAAPVPLRRRFSFRSPDPEATRTAARCLGGEIGADGLVVGLVGRLGSGKTVFAKGLGEGLGVDPGWMASPTFVIASHYPTSPAAGRAGPDRLVHVDLYRVETQAELESAGFLDWLEPGSVLAVEWSDRFPDALPSERLEVHLERGGEGEPRRAAVWSGPGAARALAERWRSSLSRTGLEVVEELAAEPDTPAACEGRLPGSGPSDREADRRGKGPGERPGEGRG